MRRDGEKVILVDFLRLTAPTRIALYLVPAVLQTIQEEGVDFSAVGYFKMEAVP